MRKLLAAVAAFVLAGCSPDPEAARALELRDFMLGCYGGEENFKAQQGKYQIRALVFADVPMESWPQFEDILRGVTARHGLRFFEASSESPGRRRLSLMACNDAGVMVVSENIDRDDGYGTNQFFDKHAAVYLHILKPDAPWQPVADDLEREFKSRWPRQNRVTRPGPT
jgi:hypothetical protein